MINMKNMKEMMNEKKMGKMNKGIKSLKSLKSLMQIFESVKTDNTDKTDKAIFATFAMQICVKCANCVMSIFDKGAYSEGSVEVAQAPTNHQVFSNLSPTMSPVRVAEKSRISPMRYAFTIVAMLTLGSWSSVVFAAWTGSGQGTNVGGTWYVLHETGVTDLDIYKESTKNLSGPGAQLTFDAKRQATGTGNLTVKDNTDHQYYSGNPGHKTKSFLGVETETAYDPYGPYLISNVNTVTSLTFKGGVTLHKYVTNIKVTMAQYLENPSETSLDCGTNELGTASTNNSVTVAWCNVPAMSYSITDDADGVFSVEVSDNSEAGKYNTATFTVTCNHTKKAGNHTAKLVITDTYGSYNKTVDLSATTTKHPNSISWTADEATKKNWDAAIEMNPTATNTDYTNYPIVLTSSNTSYATVSGHTVTFLAAGEGKTVTIYANQATSATYLAPTQVSKTFTIKKSQTIVWDETKVDPNIQIKKSRDIAGYAYGVPSGRAISYSSADASKISVSGNTITANGLGDVDIIATLAGDADYNEVTSSKTFTVKEKETIELYFDGVIIPADGTTINLKVGETSGYVTSKNAAQPITYTSTNSGVAIYDATAHRIKAEGAGSADVTLAQEVTDDYQAGSRKVKVNVSLNTTTITANVSEKTMEVGDTYDPALKTTNSEVTMSITSTNEAVAVYEDGVIKAKGAGTATLTFAQAKTIKWTGDTMSIAVTVNKKDPNLTVSGVPATAWNQTVEPVITSDNTDENCPFTIERISGEDRTARVDGSSIKVYDNNGQSVIFRVSQAGNDTYNAATKDFSFTVQKPATHVEYVKGDVTLAKDNTSEAIGFLGVPKSVKFTPTSDAWADRTYKLYWCATEDGEYTEFASFGKDKEDKSQEATIDPNAKFIKVQFDGAGNMNSDTKGTFKALTITEHAAEIVVNGLSDGYYDFGSTYEVGNQATDRAIPIAWYSVPTTTVTSSNPGVFDVITETIESEIDNADESASVTIRYHHKTVTTGTHDEATITLTSENGYSTSFKVKGKTIKKNQTLIWQDELTPISVGDVIPNPAIAPLALNYSIAETSAEGVVEVVDGVLKAKTVGTVKLHVANDGDAMWNAVSGDATIKVTNLKVQRINWDQTFTRLTTSDADVPFNASVYERNEAGEAVAISRPVTYESDNASVVTIVNGKLHVVGKGTATLTARVAGVEGVYEPAEVKRAVKVRKPSCGCDSYVLNVTSEQKFSTIASKEFSLSGEPRTLTFDARKQLAAAQGLWFYQYYDGDWHQIRKNMDISNDYDDYGPFDLERNATKIKIAAEFGSTLNRYVKNIKAAKAKYLELENTKDKTSTSIAFDDANLGQTYIQSVDVRYSDIYDMLYVDHKNKNFRITPTEIADSCGQNGHTTITIIYYAKEAINEKDTITITDNNSLTATIYVSASVSKSDQAITWNPTTELKTTDVVAFDATASSELAVTYALAEGDEDVATLTEDGKLTIKTAGDIHVTASQAGNGLYNAVALEPVTFHISKVTPSVSVAPVAAAVTLPGTLSAVSLNVASAVMLNDKGAAVAGEFSWEDNTEALSAGTHNHTVRFNPTNEAWYNETTFAVAVTASKRDQVISWDFADNQTLLCSAIVPLNAVLTDDFNDEVLNKTLSYVSNNNACAEVIENELVIKTPGTIVITVSRVEDATYNAASITRTITFEKATPVITTLPSANSIYENQRLYESALLGGEVRSGERVIAGSFHWTTEDFVVTEIGPHEYDAEFVPANADCYNRVACLVPVTFLQIERVFTNTTGDNNWNNPENWSNGFVPPLEATSVSVSKDATISDTASLGSIVIEAGKTITVENGGDLTIGGNPSGSVSSLGNIVVGNGGKVTVSNTFDIQDFVITASLGGGDEEAASGQVVGQEKLNINGKIYIEISFDPNGKITYGWYDFVVPFEVNMLNGISRVKSANDKTLVYGTDFVLVEADEVGRANGKNGWKRKSSGVLQPGKLYSISFDDEVDQNTFRFAWNGNGSVVNGSSYTAQCAEGSIANLRGWNGMGNGMLQHGYIPAGYKVQAFNHSQNRYELVEGNKTFAVGTAFFVQVQKAGDINWTAAEATEDRKMYAPARVEARATEEFCISLRKDGRKKAEDILYFSASEDATNSYMIGHDLTKMGNATSAKVAQMWTEKNGLQLCDIETPLYNNTASTPLMLFAPQGGEFTLAVEQVAEGASLYLTYNGNIIWDLTAGSYDIELDEGTNYGYGLLLEANKAPQITTGVDESDAKTETVRKVMIENQLYIISPEGQIYNVTGKKMR